MLSEIKHLANLVRRILLQLTKHNRRQLLGVLFLAGASSIADILSIGILIPFFGALINPEQLFGNTFFNAFAMLMDLHTPNQLLKFLTVVFILAIVISAAIRITLLFLQANIGQLIIHNLCVKIYKKILEQPYVEHTQVNSAQNFTLITHKVPALVNQILAPAMIIMNAVIMTVFIFIALLNVSPLIGVGSIFVFGLLYLGVVIATRGRLSKLGNVINQNAVLTVKTLNEGLGGIRDVILDAAQRVYVDKFRQIDLPLRTANVHVQVIAASPRILVESIGMILIAFVAFFYVIRFNDVEAMLPTLAAFALGAQRLLPMFQQSYQSWTLIRSGFSVANEAINELERHSFPSNSRGEENQLAFLNSIRLIDVSYRYNEHSPWVLRHIDLRISKGERIGVLGTTGGGKSTLIDILMGLLSPVQGELFIDGVKITPFNAHNWQSRIAHVPQNIFLSDASIAENIAFGSVLEDINFEKIYEVAQKAQIAEDIELLPQKYKTRVGERGVQLSGGQRQRIGIARALYKKADVIILDEGTSALDSKTEEAVIRSIENLGNEITLVMVAHRLSTLRNCRQIVEVKLGSINKIDLNDQIIDHSK